MSPAIRKDLRSFIDQRTLFAFDLDGTLAPITSDPSNIVIAPEISVRMSRLCNLARIAVLTGRGLEDARSHLTFNPHYLIGNHGAEGLPELDGKREVFLNLCHDWEHHVRQLVVNSLSGITVENKGETLSIHYRNHPDHQTASSLILRAASSLRPSPRIIHGKCVVNLVPAGAPNKGDALLSTMKQGNFEKALFVGDDETDEDVFRLRNQCIFGIRVGEKESSFARYFLSSQLGVVDLLDEVIRTLEPM
nr:trehalose-phosphatase [Pelotalea chapellei]